jgi:hypothetical protein
MTLRDTVVTPCCPAGWHQNSLQQREVADLPHTVARARRHLRRCMLLRSHEMSGGGGCDLLDHAGSRVHTAAAAEHTPYPT